MADSQEPSRPRKQNQSKSYVKYSGLAFQLLATIFVTGWLGYRVDLWLNMKYPLFMILFGFLGFGGSIYQIYRSINR